ncbi:3-mercaptopyruvate sulfurtransferase [Kutzneria viridogrisea]|uniref:Rhodanese domain-containing protein n=2 Tax=Kutzneria TaxID=43356 RepID=W5WLN8_9PSEU|nr:rhodanese-like domain-containing protein [Kutzneria albida]AHH99084.1 hypothetical protein KALB_5723 [Kutzneria albida DSM 43870]MBA8923361.1 thiosulfate/3-mercaptopyruvate sulfurtransferase [Kutzneria viridogrisea]
MNSQSALLPASLVTTGWLAQHLGEPDLLVLDASVQMVPTPPHRVPMREAYREAHLPGAVFADLVNDLSDPDSPLAITRPSAHRATTVFGQLGIGPRTRVVAYDCEFGQYAARLWWLLKSAGHDAVAVLDGGLRKWTGEGRAVESGEVEPVPAAFAASPRPGMWADKQQVMAVVRDGVQATLVNAVPELPADTSLLPEEAVRVMSTTIPGSVNVPYPSLAQPGTSMLRASEDRAQFLASVTRGRPAIVYCNSGLNAPLVGFSLLAAGHDEVMVYDGSLEEWLGDPHAPVERRTIPG